MNFKKIEILLLKQDELVKELKKLKIECDINSIYFVDNYIQKEQLMDTKGCNYCLKEITNRIKNTPHKEEKIYHKEERKFFNFLKDLIKNNNVGAIVIK